MKLPYTKPINPNDIKLPQVKILQYLEPDQKVLDVGCAAGRVSKLLFEKGCTVIGIEKDPRRAKLASPFCKKVLVGDLEDETIVSQIPELLDVIIFSDILEHLKEPKAAFEQTAPRWKGFHITSQRGFFANAQAVLIWAFCWLLF